MKAILLSAGFGKRLMPLTKNNPKCLMKINNRILLDIWVEKLLKLGIDKILINLHYKKEKVINHINKKKYKKKIKLVIEDNLLGTAKTLISNYKFYSSSEVMLIHSDNYCLDDLKKFVNFHQNRPKSCLMTMLTFNTDTPKTCGILKVSKNGIVKKIYEKHKNPPGTLANGAVYILSKDFIKKIKNKKYVDFSRDILPKFICKIFTYKTDKPFIDIGTVKNFKKSQLINK